MVEVLDGSDIRVDPEMQDMQPDILQMAQPEAQGKQLELVDER